MTTQTEPEKKEGRPTIITDEVVAKLELAFKEGANISEACLVSGISRNAYYDRINVDQKFSNKMSIAQDYVTVVAQKNISSRIVRGDPEASKWWLERKKKQEFSTRNELTGKDGAPLSLEVKDSTE